MRIVESTFLQLTSLPRLEKVKINYWNFWKSWDELENALTVNWQGILIPSQNLQ